jgi:hypothetical protein
MSSKEKCFKTTLDTLAALCVCEVWHQEFAVLLYGTAVGVTLYVSQTGATLHHVAEGKDTSHFLFSTFIYFYLFSSFLPFTVIIPEFTLLFKQ